VTTSVSIRENLHGSREGFRGALRGRTWPLLFMAAILLLAFPLYGEAQSPQKKAGTVEKRLADLEKETALLSAETDVFTTEYLPEPLTLCGKKIFLSRDDTRERFEREYFQLLENRGLLTIIVKRYLKYLSFIGGEIDKAGMPPDLIYLVITESYLNPRALSKANAAGLWQFIKETGKREGLFVTDHVDERYNVRKATRSALAHLRRLNNEYNDWLITMAAYNAGSGRLREAISNQDTTDFIQLYLPEETERYIFRILAIKQIITDRQKLGIRTEENTLYKPVVLAEVTLELGQETHVNVFAKCMEVPYRTFRTFNLQFRKYRLPPGTYTVIVPFEKKEIFLRKVKNYPAITVINGG
jgi:membrane-bound lytic murein transglycosylase D